LVPETYDQWAVVPGEYDVDILRNTFVFNCTNYEDVSSFPSTLKSNPKYYRFYTRVSSQSLSNSGLTSIASPTLI